MKKVVLSLLVGLALAPVAKAVDYPTSGHQLIINADQGQAFIELKAQLAEDILVTIDQMDMAASGSPVPNNGLIQLTGGHNLSPQASLKAADGSCIDDQGSVIAYQGGVSVDYSAEGRGVASAASAACVVKDDDGLGLDNAPGRASHTFAQFDVDFLFTVQLGGARNLQLSLDSQDLTLGGNGTDQKFRNVVLGFTDANGGTNGNEDIVTDPLKAAHLSDGSVGVFHWKGEMPLANSKGNLDSGTSFDEVITVSLAME
jgi:hypothetical protein